MNILKTIRQFYLSFHFCVLSLSISACYPQDLSNLSTLEDPATVQKSPNDEKEYEYLTLKNGLRLLLVSDKNTDKSAASLVAMRGQNHDPSQHLGLAHFFEHMLFIGTAKYPKVDEYQHFLVAHGGRSNAYTASDHTNYFFDVDPEYFQEGLDRFAHFFIDPLLDSDYVERERKAVHSEYQMQLKDDGWRGNAVLKRAMNPNYPGSQFHIGNNDTLSQVNRSVLKRFSRENYSADQMIAVILSKQSIQEMTDWVVPIFSMIPNRNIGRSSLDIPAFRDDELPVTLRYKPSRTEQRIVYSFPIPPEDRHYKEKPSLYITHLLGHEGSHSLYSYLKESGLITSLVASSNRIDEINSLLSIDIKLTAAGSAKTEEITDALFQYINLLKDSPVEEWRAQELAQLARLDFRFQEPVSPLNLVYRLAPFLSRFPANEVLQAPYLIENFDPELIREHLKSLTRENLVLQILDQEGEFEFIEPWFGVPYSKSTERTISTTNNRRDFKLPKTNRFIPNNLHILENDQEEPTRIFVDTTIDFWFDKDTQFRSPRTNLYLKINIKNGLNSPKDIALASLYAQLLKDRLNEFSYDAMIAGLNYDIGITQQGFELILSGYSDKQELLLAELLRGFENLSIDGDALRLYRDDLLQEWENFYKEKPYIQALSTLSHLLSSENWPPQQLADAAQDITKKEMEEWKENKIAKVRIQGLAHGNISSADLLRISKVIKKSLVLEDLPNCTSKTYHLDKSYLYEIQIDHPDAAMVFHIQDHNKSFASRAKSALAVQIMQQDYFTNLRTESQLGYVIALSNRALNGLAGLTFIAQSPVASPSHLYEETRKFLEDQIKGFSSMSTEEFEQHKAGLVSRLTESDKNLNDRSSRYWSDITLGFTILNSEEQISQHVKTMTKEEFQDYLFGVRDNLDKKSILIFSTGKFGESPSHATSIIDPNIFKSLQLQSRKRAMTLRECGHTVG